MSKNHNLYTNIDSFISASRAEFEEKLAMLVNIPSISMDPECKGEIRRCADTAVEFLKEIGAKAEAVETDGNPVVVGEIIRDPKFPTVSIYNHLDVQPANAEEWNKSPFTFNKVGDRYEGRGTTDDKGPALTALLAAKYAMDNGVQINIKFIWELEEEIGSPNFEKFVIANKQRLKTDSVMVSDTIWIARDKPSVPYGLRGILALTLSLQTHTKDVHSGLVGGVARNPIGELCDVIAQCYDAKTGKVKIEGFYEDVREVTKAEIASFTDSGFTTAGYKKAHELNSIRPNLKSEGDVLQAFMSLPTFEVHGIVGGYTEQGIKMIVPHQAEAKISMRLVPNQQPEKITRLVRNFVKQINPDVKVNLVSAQEAYIGDFTGPYSEAACSAMKFAFGKAPAFTREGGSIGSVLTMQNHLNCPIVFLGLSLPEHGYHAKNENYDWGQTSGGIKMFVKYFEEISRIK